MNDNDAPRLLKEAAAFVDRQGGAPGFLERFAARIGASPAQAARALDEALAARERAGTIRFAVGAGDVRTEVTSSGAKLSAGLLASPDGRFAASVRILDADGGSIAGVAVRIADQAGEITVVTDGAGSAALRAAGPSVFVQLAGAGVVSLLPVPDRSDVDLAAAHDEVRHRRVAEPARPLMEAGGVEFWRLVRKGGCDFTLLLRGEPAETPAAEARTPGVLFATWGRHGFGHRWIVPLSPSPLGLAGSLYGTEEHWLDEESVQIRDIADFIADLGDELEEVVARSVSHADAEQAWVTISRHLTPGREREAIRAALAHRGQSS